MTNTYMYSDFRLLQASEIHNYPYIKVLRTIAVKTQNLVPNFCQYTDIAFTSKCPHIEILPYAVCAGSVATQLLDQLKGLRPGHDSQHELSRLPSGHGHHAAAGTGASTLPHVILPCLILLAHHVACGIQMAPIVWKKLIATVSGLSGLVLHALWMEMMSEACICALQRPPMHHSHPGCTTVQPRCLCMHIMHV